MPKFSRGSQGRVERTGLRGGMNTGSGSESPLFDPSLGSSLAVEVPYHPLVLVSHSSHSGPSAVAFPDSPTEAITMHNDALLAAEECRQRSTQCISRLLLRKRSLTRYYDSARSNRLGTGSLGMKG